MIDKEKKAQIVRLYTVEKWRINTIAQELFVHHSTVERVLREQETQVHKTYGRPTKLDPYLPFVLSTLERYPSLTAARLYQMVRERGYDGGPSQFRHLVWRHRPRPTGEAFLRLHTLPGEQAQVDWADFGKPQGVPGGRSLSAFVMVLSFSRMLFVRFFYGQTQGLFLQGHQDACTFFGRVPRVLLYD